MQAIVAVTKVTLFKFENSSEMRDNDFENLVAEVYQLSADNLLHSRLGLV